ncbi:putative LRR receptor-like serine/threonine-protein kinase [Forsythia ovata]|uniref:non-specific serine/threonine protein kinase n=1 Tax=Forsythia ovata TaxID=205694 RepID=A0ABD1T5Y0_9LAMI
MGTSGRSQPSFVNLGLTLIVLLCWFLLLIGADSQKTHPAEVNALRAIKKSLIDPYQNLGNWNRGDPCTSCWTGIYCSNTTMDDGYLHVKEMALLNMNLSGSLSAELVHLSYLEIMDFMWNNISGTIPKEIGNVTSLTFLLLNGNNLTGSLPDEIGYLGNLDRLQIDENQISGSIPKSFANLNNAKHFHMNNNSLSGQIPPELSRLPLLVHLLLDNNNLSGHLPPELSKMPNLTILQLDNNNFEGSTIPPSYGNISCLSKLSLRNCSLQGPIPNWSNMPNIGYIDLSLNKLSGTIPTDVLSENMTTIDLSNNNLNGTIPASFSRLPLLQKLDFQNNKLSNISGSLVLPSNVTVSLQGNPICSKGNLIQFCGSYEEDFSSMLNQTSSNACLPQSCPPPFEYAPASHPVRCFCAAPLLVGYRLKSPGFTNFRPYIDKFEHYVSSALDLHIYQFEIDSVAWQKGPRLRMYLKIFPAYVNNSINKFNRSEVLRIHDMFRRWKIHGNAVFGPFELLNFTLLEPYKDEIPSSSPSGITKGALAGIIIGTAAGSVTLAAVVFLLFVRSHTRRHRAYSRRRPSSRVSIRIDGVKGFTYGEMSVATNNFNSSSFVGQGGYGKVYKGILADGTVVAIKRAQEGSLQGEKEFLTEIELLSRVHHRNLVSLIGYCDEEGEQVPQ